MSRVLLSLVFLTLVFVLVLANFTFWDFFFGAVISAGLMVFSRGLIFEHELADKRLLRRAVYFWPFLVATVWNIITGTVEVALITLYLRPLDSPGIVAVPIAGRTPVGVAVSAMASTLSPGTFLVDVDRERDVMLIHAINASDPQAVVEDHQDFYRKYQSKVFP